MLVVTGCMGCGVARSRESLLRRDEGDLDGVLATQYHVQALNNLLQRQRMRDDGLLRVW